VELASAMECMKVAGAVEVTRSVPDAWAGSGATDRSAVGSSCHAKSRDQNGSHATHEFVHRKTSCANAVPPRRQNAAQHLDIDQIGSFQVRGAQ
jgi:hypothetical protein